MALEKLVITGGTPLKGEVTINGAKNAAVAILPAALLINGVTTIENLPHISDVILLCEIIEELGAKITWTGKNTITIDARNISCTRAPIELTRKFRASYYLIGALLRTLRGCASGNAWAVVSLEQDLLTNILKALRLLVRKWKLDREILRLLVMV